MDKIFNFKIMKYFRNEYNLLIKNYLYLQN